MKSTGQSHGPTEMQWSVKDRQRLIWLLTVHRQKKKKRKRKSERHGRQRTGEKKKEMTGSVKRQNIRKTKEKKENKMNDFTTIFSKLID